MKKSRLGAFWISGSSLLHSMMTNKNEVFLNGLLLTLKWGILFALLVDYGLVNLRVILKTYFLDWCLYHRLCCRHSMLSSLKSFSLNVPRIAHVMARASLYWIVLNALYFWLKRRIIRLIIDNTAIIKVWSNESLINFQYNGLERVSCNFCSSPIVLLNLQGIFSKCFRKFDFKSKNIRRLLSWVFIY